MTGFSRRLTSCLLILSAVSSSLLFAEEVLLPEPGSSTTFYDADLESNDVDLFLSGSWKIDLSASSGFAYSQANGFDSSLAYSGITSGFAFSQSPDMTVSLIILEKILFQSAFTDKFDESTFRLGYIGDNDEFIKIISAGNMEINLTDKTTMSNFFYVPGGDSSSFGIHSLQAGSISEHEQLLRFDPQQELSKLYIGADLLTEIEKQPSDYLKGQLFYIPVNSADTVFYIECSDSDGEFSIDSRSFKKLGPADYSYSSAKGRLLLTSKAAGALLYESSSSGGITTIYEPGEFSSYEAASVYKLDSVLPDDEWKTRVYLANNADTASSGLELPTEILPDEGLIILKPAAGGSYKYPLDGVLTKSDKVYREMAVEGFESSRSLFFQIRETASAYSIDNPVKGTIRVLINGRETYNWSESGGVITFDTKPADNDRVEIVYRKNTGSPGGDLIFASANRIMISPQWLAEINGGIRWNLSEGYARQGEESSAFGSITTGLSYDSASDGSDSPLSIKASVDGGLKLLIENSAGNLLLKNGSNNYISIPLSSTSVFPASMSDTLSAPARYNFTNDDRGLLLYKDYRRATGLSGYYLQDYNTPLTAEKIFSPDLSSSEDRYKAGPYTASAGSDSRTGEILAMDYILPSNNNWVGIQLPLNPGGENIDLSGSRAISFDCKLDSDLSDLSGLEFHLEIGSIAEDLDGDGSLDAESDKYSYGFIFNDINAAAGTLIGGDNLKGSNGKLDTEDFNDNGFLDVEKPEAIVVFDFVDKPDSDWKRFRFYFNDTEPEKNPSRLQNAGFIRITAVNTTPSSKTGRILFDDFQIEGTSFIASDDGGLFVPDFSEVYESLLPAAEKAELAISSPTLSSADANSVLRVAWDASRKDWELYSYISPLRNNAYSGITFFYYAPNIVETAGEDAALVFKLSDKNDLGLKASIPITVDSSWHKVEISMPFGGASTSISIDGQESTGALLSYDAGATDLRQIQISVENSESGLLFIDEIYMNDPVLQALTGINESVEINYSKPMLTTGDIEIIGPLSFSQGGSALLNSDASTIFTTAADYEFYSKVSTSFAGAPFSANISVSGPANYTLYAGHELKIPISPIGLTFVDTFKMSNNNDMDFSKTNRLEFNYSNVSASTGFSSSSLSNLMLRKWTGRIGSASEPFDFNLSADFLLSDISGAINSSNYFGIWYAGSILAADFSYSELKQRKTNFDLNSRISGDIIGLELDTTFSANIDGENNNSNSADISLAIPFSFQTALDSINLELGYVRYVDFIKGSDSTSFKADIPILFSTIMTGQYLYSSIPFYELFDSNLPQTFFDSCSEVEIDSAEFSNNAVLSLNRNYSSRLIDLLLPYYFETGISRKIEKDFEGLENNLVWGGVWRSAALNLFGAAGIYPFFDFYFSDELNWAIETSVYQPFSTDVYAETRLNSGFSIFGHDDDIFSLDTSLFIPTNIDKSKTNFNAQFMYLWNIIPEETIDIPLFSPEEESFQVITNEETLSLTFEDGFSTELKHSTSLILPGRFSLSAYGLFGWTYSRLSESSISLFGFSFGVSGSVIF